MPSPLLTDKTVTFSEAVFASDVTPRTLRNWVDEGRFAPEGDDTRHSGKWRRFSARDVIKIALAHRIVQFGFKIDDALGIADDALMNLDRGVNGPREVVVWRESGCPSWLTRSGPPPGGYYSGVVPEAHLLVDVAAVVRNVLNRLTAMGVTAR